MIAPNGWPEIKAFYGWEEAFMGDLRRWEARMVVVSAPNGCGFIYDGTPTRGVRVHEKIATELSSCLVLIRDAGLWQYIENTGGGYDFRSQRGASVVSMHAMGAALDNDPDRNPLRRVPEETALGSEPGLGVVRIFKRRGWTWGGEWARPDAMHVQFGGGF